ncbi:cutinase-domain-containing protein [Aspergillus novoparasiticus]|uniref:cutinase n=1 Tax=Aspergillus novoparasiticus TaxID=986946 RepID=A0A5N6E7H5_9EURO|nr:cutinase-domain-containing protein [Aspergillus novoparasiticus]
MTVLTLCVALLCVTTVLGRDLSAYGVPSLEKPRGPECSGKFFHAGYRDDIVQCELCREFTLIYARGTFENGNIGSFVGPPLISALSTALSPSKLAVQGVVYAADVEGYFAGGDREGAKTIVSLVKLAKTACPNTNVVLAGYSQGAQIIHLAAEIDLNMVKDVKAMVLFGDPFHGFPVYGSNGSYTKSYCHDDDWICTRRRISNPVQILKLESHLHYDDYVMNATEFRKGRLQA